MNRRLEFLCQMTRWQLIRRISSNNQSPTSPTNLELLFLISPSSSCFSKPFGKFSCCDGRAVFGCPDGFRCSTEQPSADQNCSAIIKTITFDNLEKGWLSEVGERLSMKFSEEPVTVHKTFADLRQLVRQLVPKNVVVWVYDYCRKCTTLNFKLSLEHVFPMES